jgi:hypothetical protein
VPLALALRWAAAWLLLALAVVCLLAMQGVFGYPEDEAAALLQAKAWFGALAASFGAFVLARAGASGPWLRRVSLGLFALLATVTALFVAWVLIAKPPFG